MTSRGTVADRLTQRWVRLTGRVVSLREHPWLEGPAGEPAGIGARFFEGYVAAHGLRIADGDPTGLLPSVGVLRSADFKPDEVAAGVTDFYERTDGYDLDAWSEWAGVFRPFGWALAAIFSRRLQQLNVPLSNLDTSRGMVSDVRSVVDASTGRHVFTTWVRQLVATGRVIYSGAYSTCTVPDGSMPCVRVVFPLPNGNAIVIMRPTSRPDGSVSLVSAGAGFGSPGFYFTVTAPDGAVWARYVRSLRETIRVYEADGQLRADHVLSLWGFTFLRLHYLMRRRDSHVRQTTE